MFSRRSSLVAGMVAAALAGPFCVPYSSPLASDVVDTIVTGSINPAETLAPAQQGSAAFRAALAVLVRGDQAGAFQLAASLPDELERRTIQWAAIYYGNGLIDYAAVALFAKDAPDFASPSLLKTRIEQSLETSSPSDAQLIATLGSSVPNTLKAEIMLATAFNQSGQHDRAVKLAREIWVNSILDQDSEGQVLGKLGNLLSKDDHWARAVHLLMNDRASGAERLLSKLSPAQKSLAIAGIAVVKGASNADALLAKVDPGLRTQPVFFFMKAQQARQTGNPVSAAKFLDQAKGKLPDAPQWWYERRTVIRALLAAGNAKRAYQAAAAYTSGPDGRLVEARFHAGWIAASFLKDFKSAKIQFIKMAKLSTLPDSITQAEFWLGRAELALGDKAAAKAAFTKAAQHGTLYYGLLARAQLGLKGVELRALPAVGSSETAFDSHEVIRAVQLLAGAGQGTLAVPLLRYYAASLKDGGQLLLAARLAQTIDAHDLAIEIADAAEQRGTPLDLFSFPKDALPPTMQLADIDRAAVYAIARQESKFKVNAVSVSGALGLMQLMPTTAREIAAKMGVGYSPNRLASDSAYNALLGSTYLAGQLQHFDGSLVLAAAAYNAGASNAAKWVTAYGDPRLSTVDPVVWVELIPFEETRQYVRRVLGNYLVYRARMGDHDMTLDQALRKIPG